MQATETTHLPFRETVHTGSAPDDRFHVSPVVAVDTDGVPWVAWIKTGPDGDHLLLKRIDDPEPRVVTVRVPPSTRSLLLPLTRRRPAPFRRP